MHEKSGRVEYIRIMLTPAEKAILERAAKESGMTVGRFVRGAIFGYRRRSKK